jgi:cytoskeletal protein CcmA (bactofilin family)
VSTTIGKGVSIKGTVQADEPVAIAGVVQGEVTVMNGTVTIEPGGRVDGTVTAREVILQGNASGRIVSVGVVRMQPGCDVRAEVAAAKLAIAEGAIFNGRVEPARAEAAARVAAYRQGT